MGTQRETGQAFRLTGKDGFGPRGSGEPQDGDKPDDMLGWHR